MGTPATNKQVPDHSIMDHFRKQAYLGNQFGLALNNTSAGTSEAPLLLLNNTSTSAKGIFLDSKMITSLTASDTAVLRFYIAPTVTTVGTPATPVNARPANTNTSVMTVTSAPTVSANGTLIETLATTAFITGLSQMMQILDPGQVMLITLQTSASSAATSTQLNWWEL